ncbi:MAG TPA: hypothetical protein VHS74_20250 [Solirubrobacterales bacterium]|jgi:hypothetical protein|nr:hypothetical protein [Solirubrobacterales bacterium]
MLEVGAHVAHAVDLTHLGEPPLGRGEPVFQGGDDGDRRLEGATGPVRRKLERIHAFDTRVLLPATVGR